MVFAKDHENITSPDYEKEATELLSRYNRELNQQKITALNAELEAIDENDDRYDEILKQIVDLQNGTS